MTFEPESGYIRYEVDEDITSVVIDRPAKRNALTIEMIRDLVRGIRSADNDETVHAIIITGAGDEAFCAGGDLTETIPRFIDRMGWDTLGPNDEYFQLAFRYETLTTPLIAAVNGDCIAGGMELLHATDLRIAEEGAKFGHQEPRWGLFPAGGATVRMPRSMSYCKAMEYLLTGNLYSAEHAREGGLVNEVVADGSSRERAEELAEDITENSPQAISKIKESVIKGMNRSVDDAFRLETELAREVWASDEARERITAFRDDSKPPSDS